MWWRMKRKQKEAPVISITGAANLTNLNPWQVKHICQRYHLAPEPPQPGQDRRCKWFRRDLLLACIAREHGAVLATAA
jgi:hypothetical protein